MGDDNTAKFKLRMGLNLKTYKAYAKLRFRTEPISPFDIGEGVSCAGKVSSMYILTYFTALEYVSIFPVLYRTRLYYRYLMNVFLVCPPGSAANFFYSHAQVRAAASGVHHAHQHGKTQLCCTESRQG